MLIGLYPQLKFMTIVPYLNLVLYTSRIHDDFPPNVFDFTVTSNDSLLLVPLALLSIAELPVQDFCLARPGKLQEQAILLLAV